MIKKRRNFVGSTCDPNVGLRALILITGFVFLPAMAGAQAAPAPTQGKPEAAVPITMTECEGTNNCATWTFLGTLGNGQWPSGEIANFSVENFSTDSVVIRRADSTGASAGLTAVYKGTRHGNRIGGEFTSSWPGHWETMSGNWYATIGTAQAPPPVIEICDPQVTCGTLTWNNGHYDASWSGGAATATMTVQSFTPSSVVLRRVDLGSRAGFVYIYKGTISPSGDSILNGEWIGEAGSRQAGATGHFTATWGAALQASQQGQQQRPVVVVRPTVVCFPWFFGVVCQ